MIDQLTPIPIRLKRAQGEREIIRVEEVKLKLGQGSKGEKGSLLLTNRRLIFNGRAEKRIDAHVSRFFSVALEWFLDDILGCDIEKPLIGKKKLLLRFQRYAWRGRLGKDGKIQTFVRPINPGISKLHYASQLNEMTCMLSDIEQPEILRPEIMEQVEATRQSLPGHRQLLKLLEEFKTLDERLRDDLERCSSTPEIREKYHRERKQIEKRIRAVGKKLLEDGGLDLMCRVLSSLPPAPRYLTRGIVYDCWRSLT